MLELARARRLKVALIESAARLDRLDLKTAWLIRHSGEAARRKGRPKMAVGDVSSQPIKAPQRIAEAVRRTLPALLRLQRYEARAVAKRRDHAIRELAFGDHLSCDTMSDCEIVVSFSQNEPNFPTCLQGDKLFKPSQFNPFFGRRVHRRERRRARCSFEEARRQGPKKD